MSKLSPPLRAVMRQALLFPWLCVWLLACATDAVANDQAGSSNSQMSQPWWQERYLEKEAQLHSKPVRLIFLGDSIFHSFEWNARSPVWNYWYGAREAVDLGFNGDGIEDVIWRIRNGEIKGVSPLLALILIGANDLGKPPNQIVAAIRDLAQIVREQSVSTRIVVLGILPSGRPDNEVRVGQEVNAELSEMFSRRGAVAEYHDVSCVFFQRGQLNLALFREPAVPGGPYPLHPTERGMDLLAASIEPVVAATLGDQARTRPDALDETDCSSNGHDRSRH